MSDLTATVAAYFGIPTGSAERVAGRIVNSVLHAFFDVGNLQGNGFLASSGTTIMVSDNHVANISFLTFHYIAFYVIIHLIYIYNAFPFVVSFTPIYRVKTPLLEQFFRVSYMMLRRHVK